MLLRRCFERGPSRSAAYAARARRSLTSQSRDIPRMSYRNNPHSRPLGQTAIKLGFNLLQNHPPSPSTHPIKHTSPTMKPDYSKFSAEDTAKMEEITGIPAKAMLVQAGLVPTPPKNAFVLDNACGGGVATSILFNTIGKTSDVRVVCGDLEEYMVKSSAERIKTNGWNAEATVADAQALPFPDSHFTHTVMNFGIQVIPDATLAMKESFRVLKSGGKFGMTSWSSPGWLESVQLGVPGFTVPPMFTNGPVATKESITSLLTGAGFANINVQPVKFEHTDDISRYLNYMKEVLKGPLLGEGGEKYDAYMRNRYGDGDFTLTWEAFVITAEKP
ncbi:Methyltransf-25 domain-containing protein [Mycena venus]|uniref:Methyltransf-25 domain-containing protein n=1 Tax=Mycena venus TaxID=2733690 RepID=A0A8H6XGN3_9AGAR|nr:Methyltransf-25 domain-containing protein [Mycena venus]